MERLNLNITDEQAQLLKKLKQVTEISVSEHVRRAIDKYLARNITDIQSVVKELKQEIK